MENKISKYIVFSPDINEYEDCLIYSTKTGKLLKINKYVKNTLIKNEINKLNFTEFKKLSEEKFIISTNEDEFKEIIHRFKKSQLADTDTFTLTIAPSAFCQFNCDYCGQEHVKFNMNKLNNKFLVKKIINKIEEGKYKQIYIIWYGAEPLIGLESIKYISNGLIKYGMEKNIGFDSSIITNGLLLKMKVFDELKKLKVNYYQITIDGYGKIHNERRHLKKNKGNTFSIIYNNILEICKVINFDPKKTTISIRCNVDIRNHEYIYELLDKIKIDGIHKRIAFSIEPLYSWENNAHLLSLEKEKFAALDLEILTKMIKDGFLIRLSKFLPKPNYITCMATMKEKNELIDAFGNIFNCYEMPYVSCLQKFNLGNIFSKSYNGNSKKLPYNDWYELIENNDKYSYCKNCIMLPICGGWCPKHWIDGRDIPCPTYKINLPEKLLLFYNTYFNTNNFNIRKN